MIFIHILDSTNLPIWNVQGQSLHKLGCPIYFKERVKSMKCIFNESANKCPFLDRNNSKCSNPNKCNFQEEKPKPPVKKEKWFEQYYRNRSGENK